MSYVAIWLQACLHWRCAYFQTLSWNDTIFVVDWDILYKLCGSANKWSKGFVFSGKIWWQFFSCNKACSKYHTGSTTTPKYTLTQRLVQNRAARNVTFTKKYEHIIPSLVDLHWLPVEYRIIYKILLLVYMYKAINGLSPSYISNLLSFCSSSYSLRSCLNKLLQVTRSKLKSYGDRRFSIAAGPKLWNSTPASLRNTDSLNSFKKHLKTNNQTSKTSKQRLAYH